MPNTFLTSRNGHWLNRPTGKLYHARCTGDADVSGDGGWQQASAILCPDCRALACAFMLADRDERILR